MHQPSIDEPRVCLPVCHTYQRTERDAYRGGIRSDIRSCRGIHLRSPAHGLTPIKQYRPEREREEQSKCLKDAPVILDQVQRQHRDTDVYEQVKYPCATLEDYRTGVNSETGCKVPFVEFVVK